MQVLWGIGGMLFVLLVAWLLSVDRRRIRPRTVVLALLIQVVFAVLVLYVPVGKTALQGLATAVQAIINSSKAGIDFLFGPILPDDGNVFAFQVLPVIVFFASLTAVLYHVGLLQLVTRFIGGALAKLLGTTGPESMSAAANIFVGQTEAPLVVKPYIKKMLPSEVFAVMAGGLTTVAGSVLVGYSLLGANLDYLIAASFMAAPAGLLMAKIIVPAGSLTSIGPNADVAEGKVPADAARTAHPVAAQSGGRGSDGQPPTHLAERDVRAGDEPAEADGDRTPPSSSGRRKSSLATWLAGALRRGGRRGASRDAVDELARRSADGGSIMPDGTDGTDDHEDAGDPNTEAEDDEDRSVNVIDAASQGASDGLDLALNVGAMLLAFVSLIALGNLILGAVGGLFGFDDLTIQQILGYAFAPVMTAVGVPINEAVEAGSFFGQKIVLNEFVAFADFAPRAAEFSAKTQAVVTFALTGFANLGSLAILLGGLGGIAPSQRGVIAKLGLRAVAAGALGNLMSATIAGVLIG